MAYVINFPAQIKLNEVPVSVQWNKTPQTATSNARTRYYTSYNGGAFVQIWGNSPSASGTVHTAVFPIAKNLCDKLGSWQFKFEFVKYDGISGNTTIFTTEVYDYEVVEEVGPEPEPAYVFTQYDVNQMVGSHVTGRLNGSIIAEGTKAFAGDSFKIEAISPYEINSASITGDFGNSNTPLVVAPDKKSASVAFPATTGYQFAYDTSVIDTRYKLVAADVAAINTDRWTTTIDDVMAVVGSVLTVGSVVKTTANDGYTLLPVSFEEGGSAFGANAMDGTEGTEWRLTMTIGSGGKVATGTVATDLAVGSRINWFMSAKQVVPVDPDEPDVPPVVGEFNNLYKVDSAIMGAINKERFRTVISGSGENQSVDRVDYGGQILSLVALPFEIDPSYVMEAEPVQLGDLMTKVEAPRINSDRIRVPLGSIVVPDAVDSTGYVGVTALLYLPRLDPVSIDLEYVIGQTLTVEYLIDVYSGRATVNIASTKTGGVVVQREVDMGFNIPYINSSNQSVDNPNIQVGGDNGITKPRLDLVKSDLILPKGFYTVPVVAEGTLASYNGYATVEFIQLDFKAPLSEKEMLTNKLNSGVIINA